MPTTNITVMPSDNWKSVYTGPTETPLAVEKAAGGSTAFFAIATAAPALNYGHPLPIGALRNITLDDGENLYIRCIDGLSPGNSNTFVITD